MNNELAKLIDDLVEQKTFSLDALEAVQKVKTHAVLLSSKLEESEIALKTTKDALVDLRRTYDTNLQQLQVLKAAEAAVAAREAKQTKLECDAEKFKALADQGKEFVQLIFRNHTIMTSGMKVAGAGGGAISPGYVGAAQECMTTIVS